MAFRTGGPHGIMLWAYQQILLVLFIWGIFPSVPRLMNSFTACLTNSTGFIAGDLKIKIQNVPDTANYSKLVMKKNDTIV